MTMSQFVMNVDILTVAVVAIVIPILVVVAENVGKQIVVVVIAVIPIHVSVVMSVERQIVAVVAVAIVIHADVMMIDIKIRKEVAYNAAFFELINSY